MNRAAEHTGCATEGMVYAQSGLESQPKGWTAHEDLVGGSLRAALRRRAFAGILPAPTVLVEAVRSLEFLSLGTRVRALLVGHLSDLRHLLLLLPVLPRRRRLPLPATLHGERLAEPCSSFGSLFSNPTLFTAIAGNGSRCTSVVFSMAEMPPTHPSPDKGTMLPFGVRPQETVQNGARTKAAERVCRRSFLGLGPAVLAMRQGAAPTELRQSVWRYTFNSRRHRWPAQIRYFCRQLHRKRHSVPPHASARCPLAAWVAESEVPRYPIQARGQRPPRGQGA